MPDLRERLAPGVTLPPADITTVQARDAAIKACLAKGPASFDELLAAMPYEPVLATADQRRLATSNCLSRLRVKKQIETDGKVWSLIA